MDRKFGETKILTVNMETGGTHVECQPKLTEKFIGGRGVNGAILLQKGVDRDENGIPRRLVFGPGSLVGSYAPSASRSSIDSGNLFNDGIGSGNIGGKIGTHLRFAGYDHLVLEGRSETPKYLLITEDTVELRDAAHLWGKNISDTDEALRKDHGESAAIMYIGPAGENLVRSACIVSDKYRTQGRCGLGVVLGAMKLKAIVIPKYSGKLLLAEPEKFREIVKNMRDKMDQKSDLLYKAMPEGGMASLGHLWVELAMPVRNLQDDYLPVEKRPALSPDSYLALSTKTSAKSCSRCSVRCDVLMEVSHGPGKGTKWAGIEGDAAWDFGAKLDINDASDTVYLRILCNELGLDSDSVSGAMSWAFESYERGVLTTEDTDGLELEWGNNEAAIALMHKIAYREGIGDLLAEGAAKAAKITGKGSEAWAIQIKGQDSIEPIRVDKGWALGCAVSPRGGSHTRGAALPFGSPPVDESYNPSSYTGQVERVVYMERTHAFLDSIGLCSFTSQWLSPLLPGLSDYGDLFGAASGREITDEEKHRLGEDVMMLEKIYNQQHTDFDRSDDYPPERMTEMKVSGGPFKGECLELDDWDKLLDEYYEKHGWDLQSGLIGDETVTRLMESVKDGFSKTGEQASLIQKSRLMTSMTADKAGESKGLAAWLKGFVFVVLAIAGQYSLAECSLKLATTTSTENSGLLADLLPDFERRQNCRVDVIAVGTGKALKLGEMGDVDVVMVHARSLEEKFVAEGFGVERHDLMFNDFVLVGPTSDPGGAAATNNILDSLKRIATTESVFISRGDRSGTHHKEQTLWKSVGIEPKGDWYQEAGRGMGEVLMMANERLGYTLTDRGTYVAFKNKIELDIVSSGDKRLFNPYGVIAVNPAKHPHVQYKRAQAFINYLLSDAGQRRISAYRKNGEPLFFTYKELPAKPD